MCEKELAAALIDWFATQQRDLPWRRTGDAYAIWVSEIMLQQTQVQSVIPYYERFMARFPTLRDLADADEEAVIRAWAGLGYYSRARNLRHGVRLVIEQYGGVVPSDPELLQRLPGIGRYTAGAIASIAYNVAAPILDGNVIRVLCRLFGLRGDPKRAPLNARLWELAESLIPPGEAARFNPAMMELGATLCTPTRPACHRCPVATWCAARVEGVQEELPETASAPKPEPVPMVAGVLRTNGAVMLCRGLATARARPIGIASMWQFPNGEQQPGESAKAALQRILNEILGIEADVGAPTVVVRHAVTRYRVTLTAHECRRVSGAPVAVGCAEWAWVATNALDGHALPAAHRRLADALFAPTPLGFEVRP